MPRIACLLVASFALLGCGTGIRVAGGDGLRPESAVTIEGQGATEAVNESMRKWVSTFYPGAAVDLGSSRYVLSSRVLYAAKLNLAQGGVQLVYFDLTGYRPQ